MDRETDDGVGAPVDDASDHAVDQPDAGVPGTLAGDRVFVSWSTGEAYTAPVRRRRWPAVAAASVALGALLVAAQFAGGNGGDLSASGQDPDGPGPTPVASGSGYDRIAAPSEGVGETPRPATIPASPLPAGSSTDFAYLDLQADGVTPITWSPCRPIHYAVRAEDEPAGGLRVVQSAIAEISSVTGLTFVYDGRTTETPVEERTLYQPDRYGERWAPVLVAWTEHGSDPGLVDDTIAWASPYSVIADDGGEVIVSGEIHIDRDWFADELADDAMSVARATVLHELGHLVGLDHVSNPSLLMNPDGHDDVVDFTAGEKRGLASLGAGACHSDV